MGLAGGKLPCIAVALVLALSLASCGGDDDSTTGNSTATAQSEAPGGTGNAAQGGEPKQADDSGKGSGSSDSGSSSAQHNDSGGGSAQFKTKGGDNSVQDFGSEASASEFDQAAAALHGFLDARVRGDWSTTCSYMAADVSKSLQQLAGKSKELADGGCAETLAAISEGVPKSTFEEAAKADIGSLRVEGDRAFLIYRGANNVILALPMKDEDGSWKVGSLAGTPLS